MYLYGFCVILIPSKGGAFICRTKGWFWLYYENVRWRTRTGGRTTVIFRGFRIIRICGFGPRDLRVCVRCMEGRSVRSTERSEARKGAAPLGATP
jgi:hypothetical protein